MLQNLCSSSDFKEARVVLQLFRTTIFYQIHILRDLQDSRNFQFFLLNLLSFQPDFIFLVNLCLASFTHMIIKSCFLRDPRLVPNIIHIHVSSYCANF